ncbi:MAG: alpha/beta hydrolase [Pseudomonadota bacterium]
MTAIFRNYDRSALEAQFQLTGVDDLSALQARRQRASDEANDRFRPRSGLAYGDLPGETLDVYLPDGADAAPVQIYIHGGFWRSLDAALFSFVANGFVPAGIVTVIIDYPLIPETDLAGCVASCFRALSWVRGNIARCGGDPENIHVSGSSAGGHLVAELAHPGKLAANGLPPDTVKSVCAISGLFELEAVRLSSQNETLRFDEATVDQFSPQRHLVSGFPPTLVTVGGLETAEFLVQSEDYALGLGEHGNQADLQIVPNANHLTIVLDHFAKPGTVLNGNVLGMMRTV